MRLIDADNLIKIVEEWKKPKTYSEADERQNAIIECILYNIRCAPTVPQPDFKEGYKQAISRPKGEWIPVSERLPDKNMPCLVSVGKLNFTQIAMYSDLMGTREPKIFYQNDYGKGGFQNITAMVNAWQPLPEPYKEGGAE